MFRNRFLTFILTLGLGLSLNLSNVSAAPGDILFSDDFEGNLSQWTVDVAPLPGNTADASIGSETSNSGSSSLRTRWGRVTVTSNPVNLSVPSATLDIWVRRGADAFSEDPDGGEDLQVGYINDVNDFVVLETFIGDDTQGEIFIRNFDLPADALHPNFQVQIRQEGGSGFDWDYWHVDDVIVTETGVAPLGGLIGEWRFDELFWNGTNNEVIDSSGNGLHLTAFSAQTANANPAIAGDPGTCAYGVFNGSVSFIQLDDDTSTADSLLDIPDNLTITVWINTNVIPGSGLKSILSKDENYEFHINTSGEIYWWWRWGTLTTSGANITPGQWHHVAVTWRSGEQVIYVDGVERARSTSNGTLDINNDPLQVGQDLNIPSRFFDGFIDEVRIYENFASAAQINQIMNETRPCITAGICSVTFEDNFPSAAYNNSTGSEAWATDWIETDDDGSPSSGNIVITGGQLRMDDRPNSGGQPSIEREMNLTGYINAFISVDLQTSNNLEGNDRFDIAVSDDGGNTYTILESFNNDFAGNFNYDLTPYMSANTRIRFRIERNYGGPNERISIDNVVITGQRNCGPDHFRIIHDGSGINCLREAIQIRVEDNANNLITNYDGTINLSLSTNNGTWFTVDNAGNSADPASGTLTDTTANDGAATYQFNTADGGSVILYLQNTVAEVTNINIDDGTDTDDNSEGNITFRPVGFTFTPSPIPTQVAGRPFDVTLTAAGQMPPNTAECRVIEEYTGVKSLNLWSDYDLPVTSPTQVTVNNTAIGTSEASSTSQNVTFVNGSTTLSVRYDDVGRISLRAKDDTGIGDPVAGTLDEIIGGISPFVVRPFGYHISVTGDPYADSADDLTFRRAGQTFPMTVRSVLWQSADDIDNDGYPDPFIDTNNDAIPDTGGDLSDNGVTRNISLIPNVAGSDIVMTSAVIAPSPGNNGIFSNNSLEYSNFPPPNNASAGTMTFNQSWSEVGIAQFNLVTADFMNGGQEVRGERINVGRFIPDNFSLTIANITPACGSFSYAGFFDGVNAGLNKDGQGFNISGNITARNTSNATTQNYIGAFAKLTNNNISALPYDTNITGAANGRINFSPAALNFVAGVTTYEANNTHFQMAANTAPFDLRVDITAIDSDAITSGTINSNTIQTRLGRARILDSYGSELSDLETKLLTEYFDGTGWSLNTADSCTNYIQTDAIFDASSYTDNLNSGETSTFSPASLQTLVNGESSLANGIWFSAPGENNFGTVQINLNLSTKDWLRFDWTNTNNAETPRATLSFGYYRGSDRVIFWREI